MVDCFAENFLSLYFDCAVSALPKGKTVYFKVQAYRKDGANNATSYNLWSKVVSYKVKYVPDSKLSSF